MRTERLELLLTLRSTAYPGDDFAPLLTFSRNRYHRNLAIGQEGRDLVLRLRMPETQAKGGTFRVPAVFPAADAIDVGVLVEPRRLVVTIDGEQRLERSLPARPWLTWDLSYRVALGNEVDGNRPWLGELHRAVVRAGDLHTDLAAPGVLERPERYWYAWTTPQLVPFRDASTWDLLRNVVGYLPLGLLLGARRRATAGRARPAPWVAVLLVSLTLELLQFFVKVRCPSTGDLLLNLAGGAVGAWWGSLLMLEWMARRARVA